MYDYYLGAYMYSVKTKKIYKRVWWFIYKRIDNVRYVPYIAGVREVNRLNGIIE